jgi:arylsulfatase A-like enzyme
MSYLCLHLNLLALALVPCFAKNHVLFIVIDDLGFDDVGFRSHEIRTPTIDALAARGVVLDSYYVQDVCSPSRATFMTGRYAMHHTVVDWIPPASAYGLPLNETTMAEKFKQAGYATHMSGKCTSFSCFILFVHGCSISVSDLSLICH